MKRRDSLKLIAAGAGAALLGSSAGAGTKSKSDNNEKAVDSMFTPKQEVLHQKPVFMRLRMGDVKPTGWIREQMRNDLELGFAGRLDQLCHEASADIFATGRNSLTHVSRITKYGDNFPIDAASVYAWWNGEAEGNWRAGFVMLAYLSGDETYMRKADAWVRHVLSFQDEDGYLGINAPELRYVHPGEWWTQACLLRGLLAYAELTRDPAALHAVREAMDHTISVYQDEHTTPPWSIGSAGSSTESHDLALSDVLERLFELTGDAKYRDFALWAYDDWSKVDHAARKTGDDNLANLLDRSRPLFGHGVHTLENLRMPLWLWIATGREDLGEASRNGIYKLAKYSMTGGSTVSSEMIDDQVPDPNRAEFEYCTTKETMVSYESALQKTGLAEYAEIVERVFFNDAQGSRLPDGSAVSYFTCENRLRLDGRSMDGSKPVSNNKYSPTHADVAVCCNPMATQIAAYFVHNMWMRHRDGGLTAALYGPSTVSTIVDNVRVSIEEQTDYPFSHTVDVIVRPEKPVTFRLYFRNPAWSRETKIDCAGGEVVQDGDYWIVTKQWKQGDRISLEFTAKVKAVEAVNGEFALQYGALLFALPIAHKKTVIKHYAVPGFEDTHYEPLNGAPEQFLLNAAFMGNGFGFKPETTKPSNGTIPSFDKPTVQLHGEMLNGTLQRKVALDLVPLGSAPILRRLTFPANP